jgi:hypothetical protein
MAYVLYGDPMARAYRPVEGKGYAVIEAVGGNIEEVLQPGSQLVLRVGVRRDPPVWHTDRLVEVPEEPKYENLTARVVAPGLEIKPADPVPMVKTKSGEDYFGWVTLGIPETMSERTLNVEVYFVEGRQMVHMHAFPLTISNLGGNDT